MDSPQRHEAELDVAIVGAGFAGLYMLHNSRQLGFRARVFEAGGGIGGTWYWNRYPGARCDIESMEYSYSFDERLQQEWTWTERYASQPEILSYAEHVAERFELNADIELRTRIVTLEFSEDEQQWTLTTERGNTTTARAVVMATGCLSSANVPDLPGASTFAGRSYHTGRWPHDGVDFTGLRVALFGTGSSAVQAIPLIAEQASELTVYQRTPTYAVPARNEPLKPDEVTAVKQRYASFRQENRRMPAAFGASAPCSASKALEVSIDERKRSHQTAWDRGGLTFLNAYGDLLLDHEANATAAEFVRRKIREIVRDPEVAARLSPSHVIGCKRLCIDSGYYETFNRPNVELVDLRSTPVESLTINGVRTSDRERHFDAIVYATGFDAMTGALLAIDIRGRHGRSLRESWQEGPKTYLGLAVAGFPNLFMITGPGSPSVLTNMIVSIEHHVEWIGTCLADLRRSGHRTIEATTEAQTAWVDHVNSIGDATLFPTCNSWYLGANVPGKRRVFMPLPGFPAYADHCAAVARDRYRGFVRG